MTRQALDLVGGLAGGAFALLGELVGRVLGGVVSLHGFRLGALCHLGLPLKCWFGSRFVSARAVPGATGQVGPMLQRKRGPGEISPRKRTSLLSGSGVVSASRHQ